MVALGLRASQKSIHISIVLLSKLNNLDVDPHLLRWVAAFLTNRSQRVRIGNSLSPPGGLNGGTPQGTKLAPLLFCILLNGMAAKCKKQSQVCR